MNKGKTVITFVKQMGDVTLSYDALMVLQKGFSVASDPMSWIIFRIQNDIWMPR